MTRTARAAASTTSWLVGPRPADDPQAAVALVGVQEARRRILAIEEPGLWGEAERVRKLARSVVSLGDHYDTLTGVVMCLACDHPILGGEPSQPSSQGSAFGGAVRCGRIHDRCENTVRIPR